MSAELVRVLWDKSWFEPVDPSKPLVPQNTRGDAAANLCAERCRLSFFRRPDGMDVEMIAIAVATLRAGLDDVDYCLVDQDSVVGLGCTLDSSVPGETHFVDINALHVDVCELNLPRLSDLTYLAASTGRVGRVRGRQVRKLLQQAVDQGRLDVTKLKPGLRKALE